MSFDPELEPRRSTEMPRPVRRMTSLIDEVDLFKKQSALIVEDMEFRMPELSQ